MFPLILEVITSRLISLKRFILSTYRDSYSIKISCKGAVVKKNTWNRLIFDAGLNILKNLLFVVAFVMCLEFAISTYLGVIVGQKIIIIFGIFLALSIEVYDLITSITSKLIYKIHEDFDRNEAIEILEKNQLSVGMLLSDLPKDSNGNELRECVDAYMTLINQKLPFVLVNSENVAISRLYFLGKQGKHDYNKYKLIVER